MKMQFISLCGFLSLAPTLLAQTSFQDLNFESVTIVPLQDHWGRVSLAAALPGWLGYTGNTPLDRVQYNATFLDSTGISIVNANTFLGGPIQGYTVLLQAGVDLYGGNWNIRADVALAQTGTIPLETQSLRFAGRPAFNGSLADPFARFAVSFGGESLGLLETGTQGDYQLYAADVSAFAGRTGELRFFLSAGSSGADGMRNVFLDSIEFSPTPVPEPAGLKWLMMGAATVWLLSAKSRPQRPI